MNGAPDRTNGKAQICRSLISPAPTRRSPLAPAQPASARRRTAVPVAFRLVADMPRRDQRAPGARRCARRRSAPERPRARAPQAAHSSDDHPAQAGRPTRGAPRPDPLAYRQLGSRRGRIPPPLVAQAAVDGRGRALFARTPPPQPAQVVASTPATRDTSRPRRRGARVGRSGRDAAGQRSRNHPPKGGAVAGLPLTRQGAWRFG